MEGVALCGIHTYIHTYLKSLVCLDVLAVWAVLLWVPCDIAMSCTLSVHSLEKIDRGYEGGY